MDLRRLVRALIAEVRAARDAADYWQEVAEARRREGDAEEAAIPGWRCSHRDDGRICGEPAVLVDPVTGYARCARHRPVDPLA